MTAQLISEATSDPKLFGQAGLKVKFDPEHSFNPALIRFLFHALRSTKDSVSSFCPAHTHYWHYSLTEGFDNALFTDLFAPKKGPSDFPSTAKNALESFDFVNDYIPAETILVANVDCSCAVAEGEFITEKDRILYRSIAVAIPKDENDPSGPHCVYLRSESDGYWIMFDDLDGVYQTHIRHSEIAYPLASSILYKRMGDFPCNNFDLIVTLEFQEFNYDRTLPSASAALRLLKGCRGLIDEDENQELAKSDPYISNLSPYALHPKEFLKKVGMDKAISLEKMLTTICEKWMIPVVMNEEDFKTLAAKGALYFPKNGQPVGTGSFTTAVPVAKTTQFCHYRAIGMIVPKDESNPDGAQIVYLRFMSQSNWVAFDDASRSFKDGIPHDTIAHLKPTVIVYGMTNLGF